MKRVLLLTMCALMISRAAMADHIDVIGIFSDATGASCNLGDIAGQFSTSATIIHKNTSGSGATGSRFRATFPPGTAIFALNTPYVAIGSLQSDLALGYGQCLSGCIVIGTLSAFFGVGEIQILPAEQQANVIYTDCSFVERTGYGGYAGANFTSFCNTLDVLVGCTVAVEPSTWGSVKSLYR